MAVVPWRALLVLGTLASLAALSAGKIDRCKDCDENAKKLFERRRNLQVKRIAGMILNCLPVCTAEPGNDPEVSFSVNHARKVVNKLYKTKIKCILAFPLRVPTFF